MWYLSCASQAPSLPCLPGVVAQLGERIHGMDEVRGSIPLDSTAAEFGSHIAAVWRHRRSELEFASYPGGVAARPPPSLRLGVLPRGVADASRAVSATGGKR